MLGYLAAVSRPVSSSGELSTVLPVGSQAKIFCPDLNKVLKVFSVKLFSSGADVESLVAETADQCKMLDFIKDKCDNRRSCQARRPSSTGTDLDPACADKPLAIHYRCTGVHDDVFGGGGKRNNQQNPSHERFR
ncbi:hypothetical protein BV898_09088 [Hypsibius exemplaris]|uniref:Uncharacterized protein n=1 Tax=Hypsibius exemplaris TaxID=2072580 RepID=A0A1W0WND4_HYPEX|nr:hypothetical protein BV898_09088 [Hypsibius exemplaris]